MYPHNILIHDISLSNRRRYFLIANIVIGLWLFAGIVVAILRRLGFDLSWWLSVHTITIGVVASAILIYSHHFAEALTRTASQSYGGRLWRLILLQLFLVGLMLGQAGVDWGIIATTSALGVVAVFLVHFAVLVIKLRGSLAGSFVVTINYYLLATLHLIVAIILAIVASYEIGDYGMLIVMHSRLAVWGFAVLTVLGTVVTLLPTVARSTVNIAVRNRMGRALVVYCIGLYFALVAMAVTQTWAAALGIAVMGVAVVLIIQPIFATILTQAGQLSAAAYGMIGGSLWLVGLLALDAYSFIIKHDGRDFMLVILLPLVFGGFAQLITSVLSHLLPVLIGGGVLVAQTQTAIMRTGFARLALFNLGGVFALFGHNSYALLLVMPATIWTLMVIGTNVYKQRKLVVSG